MQNSSQDEETLNSSEGSPEKVSGYNIEDDGESTPKKSRPNVEDDPTKNYRVKHSDPTDDDNDEGCQMAITKFLDCMHLVPSGLKDYGSATLHCKI